MIEQFWLVLSGCFNLLHKEVTLPICACCFSKPLLCPVLGNGERFWKEQSHTSSKHTIPVQPRWMPGIPTSSIPVLLETAWSNNPNRSAQLRLGMESLKVHQELGMMEKCSAMQAWQVSPHCTCLEVGSHKGKWRFSQAEILKPWPDYLQFWSLPPHIHTVFLLIWELARGSLQIGKNNLFCALLHIFFVYTYVCIVSEIFTSLFWMKQAIYSL